MADVLHNHVCPECFIEWDHEAADCDLDVESSCEDCLVEQIYWVEETITTRGFQIPGGPDRQPTPWERRLMYIGGFKEIRHMDLHYVSRAQLPQRESQGQAGHSHNRPLEKSGLDISRSNDSASAAIEFSAHLKDFNKAVKYLLVGTSGTGQDSLEMVDLNARAHDVELVTTGVSSPFPTDVRSSGYARLPLLVFERISRAIRNLQKDSIQVVIETGTIRVGKLSFLHPEISLRLIGARIADLPIDAPLPEVLALQARFRPEEIEDSGQLAKVLEAREQASKLIDEAFVSLEQLGIERAALGRFVLEQIAARGRPRG